MRHQLPDRLLLAVVHLLRSLPVGKVPPAAPNFHPGHVLEGSALLAVVRGQPAYDALVDEEGTGPAGVKGMEPLAAVVVVGDVLDAGGFPFLSLADVESGSFAS